MAATHHRLGNIVGIVDRNMYQVDGHTEEITALEPLADKWRAFGWEVLEVNGHDIPAMVELFDGLDVGLHRSQPTVVIAHTIKGRGVKFMEENPTPWHYAPMTVEQIKEARRDLGGMEPIIR
jgi:transketolase